MTFIYIYICVCVCVIIAIIIAIIIVIIVIIIIIIIIVVVIIVVGIPIMIMRMRMIMIMIMIYIEREHINLTTHTTISSPRICSVHQLHIIICIKKGNWTDIAHAIFNIPERLFMIPIIKKPSARRYSNMASWEIHLVRGFPGHVWITGGYYLLSGNLTW